MRKLLIYLLDCCFLSNIMVISAYCIQECYAKSDNLDLPSYLITPVQRLPRYVLLLRVCMRLSLNAYLSIHSIFLFEAQR